MHNFLNIHLKVRNCLMYTWLMANKVENVIDVKLYFIGQ